MNGATAIELGGAASAAQSKTGERRRLRPRHLWLVPGLAIAVFANQLGNLNGVGIVAMIAFGIAPDLPRLLGSRGRPAHDLLHHPVAALAAVALAAAGTQVASGAAAVVVLVGALVWLSHVAIGFALGDVRRAQGAQHGA